ncbi:MAG: cobalamin B12-binding domain-containing protein [Planctomycetes bacterium]|nr:cobalamin B12-binding domain-containing protein [Planctomycetota bacterium]
MISKIGLDGHDRGAKLIVRNLRDAGMEVIYTGLWQTPAATVQAALQEDCDVLGVSLLSAAHMTVMPEVLRLAREAGIGEMPAVVGGIIPEQDKEPLRAMGCAGVFNPGTPMAGIVETLNALAITYRQKRSSGVISDLRHPVQLAQAITAIAEGKRSRIEAALGSLPKRSGFRVGVTGSPGVGKSTFIGKLARQLRERGRRVAVVAVDPSSPITGGSLLGDRLRMMSADPDDGLYVRSLASSGQAGGLAPHVDEIIDLLIAVGFEVVLTETVGAGQNDVDVRKVAAEVLLLVMPGAGDSVQFDKAGVVEIATGFVVNKADLPGADKTIKELRDSVHDGRPVWSVSALRSEGLEPLCDWIEQRIPS